MIPEQRTKRQELLRQKHRNLADAVVLPAIRERLYELAALELPVVIIGELALGCYRQPRHCDKIEVVSIDPVALPGVEVVDIGVLLDHTLTEAEEHQVGSVSLMVASARCLVALALKTAMEDTIESHYAKGDVGLVVEAHGRLDLTGLPLSHDELKLYDELSKRAIQTL